MKAALAATDHHQLAVELAHASFRLEESFKDAVCEVDCADATGGDGADDAVKIAVHVQEKARHTLSYSTAAKDGEGSLEVAWTVRHLLPYGERLRTAVSMGLNGSNQFRAMFARPHAVEGISLSGEAFTEAHADPSQALPREKRRGVVVRGAQHEGPHSVSLEVCERSWASPGVGERPSLKVALSHRARRDTRDDPGLPSAGALLEHEFEVAGFPVGAHFWRERLSAEAHAARGRTVLSVFGSFGILQGLGGLRTRLSDKLFLGGPSSLRGFRPGGVGPRLAPTSGGGPAGGDLSFSLGTAAAWRVPMPTALAGVLPAMRAQVWTNVGSAIAVPQGESAVTFLPTLFRETRTAVGVSLFIPTAFGRLEASLCRALVSRESDRPTRIHLRLESELN
mmetsp:Transcript_2358/g.5590  ORF Transcript_2358/g.5590 Transcript_2358/m.5590 type:complete len:395 (-) Transcript_2358:355-1539(-)